MQNFIQAGDLLIVIADLSVGPSKKTRNCWVLKVAHCRSEPTTKMVFQCLCRRTVDRMKVAEWISVSANHYLLHACNCAGYLYRKNFVLFH